MKKVLSVLLAAAMVMGMSVSAFAATNDKVWGKGPADAKSDASVAEMYFFEYMNVKRDGKEFRVNCDTNKIEGTDKDFTFEPGDDVYFWIMTSESKFATNGAYKDEIDADWSINIKANSYVEDAYFVAETKEGTYSSKSADLANDGYRKLVCVEIDDEYDDLDEDEVNFYLYIADNANKEKSAKATVKYDFDNVNEKIVDFDFTNDADHTAKWIVREGKSGIAVFDFEDNCYFTVKMVSKEEVILNFESKDYVKAIDKLFDYEAEYTTYNFKGNSDSFTKKGELFIEADDDTFIYEYVDGELVEVDAEYVEDYKVANCGKELDGWVIKTNELGYYVVSDTEYEVAESEDNTNSSTSTDKTNPETGANDFVGAAVALAVVSVAAAGALAFKK